MKTDLLEVVQPSGGWFAIVGIRDGQVRQKLVDTREKADVFINTFSKQNMDVYFGVAKYKSDAGRSKDNVQALKSLWVDIDCGEDKAVINEKTGKPSGYINQTAGITALQGFCRLTGLPKPLLVNSGRGIHAYWILTKEAAREQWEPVAERLRELCLLHNFYVDPSVFEAARILRVPDTLNYKDDPPLNVFVLNKGGRTGLDIEAMGTLLGLEPVVKISSQRELSALAKSMVDNSVSSFSKIIIRSAKGDGCQQLLDSFMNQETLPEPRWFNALSVAKFCIDKDTAIHKMSENHLDYTPERTERKIAHIGGPQSCKEFEKENPGGCEGCSHQGKITGPIALGKEYLAAAPEDNEVIVEDIEGAVEAHQVPVFPEPYYRGRNGGIYLKIADEEVDDIRIYEHDLYVVKRMTDPNEGEVVVMKLHLPRDGVKEFIVSNKQVADKRELRIILAEQGVVAPDKTFLHILNYVIKSIQELQFKRKAEKMRLQFGWADGDSKFILGDREITAGGTYHSPPSTATAKTADKLNPAGTMEKWKEVFDIFRDEEGNWRKGLEPHAFSILTAFGAPLFRFFGQKGAIINVIHPRSGTGKTTLLHMCNSVYGNPEGLCLTFDDTWASKIHLLGVMNNLPFTMDEITSMKPEEFSMLVYSISQGKGRERMKASANELRINAASWQTIALTSANASFNEKLGVFKNNADGELMRLVEYKIEHKGQIPTAQAKDLFDHQLLENYGHAGEIYIRYIVENMEAMKQEALNIQKKLDTTLEVTERERFWSAVIAANLTGGLIANRLGLIDWDMGAIYKWAVSMIKEMREDVKPPVTDITGVIGDYINRHLQNILAVDDAADKRTKLPPMPLVEPKGDLLIRMEPDTLRTYLSTKQFRADCVASQINYKETIRELKIKGIFIETSNKRLSKGMQIISPAVRCLVLDCSGPDFIDIKDFTPQEDEDK